MFQLFFDPSEAEFASILEFSSIRVSVSLGEHFVGLTKSSLAIVIADSRRDMSAIRFSSVFPRGFCFLSVASCDVSESLLRFKPVKQNPWSENTGVERIHDCVPSTSFSSHFLLLPCVLLPPVIRPLLWMIVPSKVTATKQNMLDD